ncbi:MAG: SRPBCC family protein [Myxococcota bacterium]
MEAEVVWQVVAVDAARAYAYAHRVENLPDWAAGLASGLEREGDAWYAASPMGRVRLEMAEDNPLGVLDHTVTMPDGTRVHNAFRVTPLGAGHCVFTFTVQRPPGTDDDAFAADVAQVRADLRALAHRLTAV